MEARAVPQGGHGRPRETGACGATDAPHDPAGRCRGGWAPPVAEGRRLITSAPRRSAVAVHSVAFCRPPGDVNGLRRPSPHPEAVSPRADSVV